MARIIPLISIVLSLLFTAQAFAVQGLAGDSMDCFGCHGDRISTVKFSSSVHGKNGCTSCHLQGDNLKGHMTREVAMKKVDCSRCHSKEQLEYAGSLHAAKGIGCPNCHGDIHVVMKWDGSKKAVIVTCVSCHQKQKEFLGSVHGKAAMAGNNDAAACNDCHGLHNVKKVEQASTNRGKAFHSAVCIKCHSDEQMMTRNGMRTEAVASYLESYHGKSYRLGFPERTAGCSDCHSAHGVAAATSLSSTVNHKNLTRTCGSCHPKSTTLFTRYYAHGTHSDRNNYPILYWTFVGMTGLLVGTFGAFWLHTVLWLFRGFVENREKKAALMNGHVQHIPGAHQLYRRFKKRHIFLHISVIVSFLGLSLTGLPLKFCDQSWAKTMMSFYGGVHYAGLIHRGCAIITFYYFLGALFMSLDFLFLRKDISGNFLQRMFGPDSLMPNLRDLREVQAMIKWFLFRGPKPTFDRWTYWEKFDFLAVFWGMFAIGGSGLMLWFPEIFGQFLPGWALNVATIVHSDEALLATGFIFTVHFFNTHGRPEKFPMDFVIFNGHLTKEEFIEERGLQWNRYQELGITESLRAEKPSGAVYDFVFKSFGFSAFLTGVTLFCFMLYAFS